MCKEANLCVTQIFLKFTWPWKSFSASGTFHMLMWSHKIKISTVFLLPGCLLFLFIRCMTIELVLTFVMSSGALSLLFHHYCWNDSPWSLTSHVTFHQQSSWLVKKKKGEIWEMTKAITPICFCCHTVTSDCLSPRT